MNGLGIGDTLVRKVSEESITIAERKYTFDSVLDSNSSQVRRVFEEFFTFHKLERRRVVF